MNDLESTHLIVERKHVGKISAALVALIAVTFMIGYFQGKRQNLDLQKINLMQESINDQVNYGLTIATHDKMQSTYNLDVESHDDLNIQSLVMDDAVDNLPDNLEANQAEAPTEKAMPKVINETKNLKSYAQLVGYGNKSNALKFYNRLKNKGYPVIFKERPGNKPKNSWYQVVTDVLSHQDLEKIVAQIAKEEKIKPVIIKLQD
jgi:hypothetical protein